MKITISVSGKLPQSAVGRPVGSAERVASVPGQAVDSHQPRPGYRVSTRVPLTDRPALSRRVAAPPLAALSLRRHQDSGGRSPSAKGQPEETLTRHQPSSMPSTPQRGVECQCWQPGSPMSSLETRTHLCDAGSAVISSISSRFASSTTA